MKNPKIGDRVVDKDRSGDQGIVEGVGESGLLTIRWLYQDGHEIGLFVDPKSVRRKSPLECPTCAHRCPTCGRSLSLA